MADDDQLAFILRSLTQMLKDYSRQRNDMNVMSAMVFRLDGMVAASAEGTGGADNFMGCAVVHGSSPAEFGKFITDDTEKWAKVIKFAGIKAE